MRRQSTKFPPNAKKNDDGKGDSGRDTGADKSDDDVDHSMSNLTEDLWESSVGGQCVCKVD